MSDKPTPKLMSAVRLVVRTRKEDSALLYHILEGHEGLAMISTLFEQAHTLYRDVELLFDEKNRHDVMTLLEELGPMVALSRE